MKPSHKQHSSDTITVDQTSVFVDEVRVRAYELYEQRGREDGHDLDDWLRAESDIKRKLNRAVAA